MLTARLVGARVLQVTWAHSRMSQLPTQNCFLGIQRINEHIIHSQTPAIAKGKVNTC